MRLEDAFKESNVPGATRVEDEWQVIIRYLPNNEGVLLRRVYPIDKKARNLTRYLFEDEEIFPHLGALIYKAIKHQYTEVRRYAKDWQPLLLTTEEKAQANMKTALIAFEKGLQKLDHNDYSEQPYHNIEDEFTYVSSNGDEDNPYDYDQILAYWTELHLLTSGDTEEAIYSLELSMLAQGLEFCWNYESNSWSLEPIPE